MLLALLLEDIRDAFSSVRIYRKQWSNAHVSIRMEDKNRSPKRRGMGMALFVLPTMKRLAYHSALLMLKRACADS